MGNSRVKHFKPNVAYELLIDGVYRYYGSHCLNRKILYESEIRARSGNRLAGLCNTGKMSREEYNARVKVLYIWEFDTAQEALDKEAELIKFGKEQYGEFCFNVFIGNNKQYKVPGWWKEKQKERQKESWGEKFERDPLARDFFVRCGLKGISKNPSLLRSRKVYQYDNGVLIAEYPSLSAAEKATGIDHRNIAHAANGKAHTAGGFNWVFATP